ncbi:MAG: 3-dehydroquinate synthase [Clostridiales bacterium]|nr:3-dehydroquinate synthase [Clostridiales bacterium]
MKTVTVNASKDYNIYIGNNLLDSCGERIKNELGVCSAAIITDDNVNALYADRAEKSLSCAGFRTVKFVFPHGEDSKSLGVYSDILNFLAENHITRSDMIISLGGGIPGDIGGFAAATFLRGIKLVQMPTTLLSAVDSSVGGKTAVNLPAGKNLAGAFYQPNMVICDYSTLDTLPPEIFADGCAETIKYGVILDKDFFEFLQNNDIKENIEYVITRCVELKRDIVDMDEKDLGIRAILNFGHTIGHAIEINSEFEISHGSAVAIGMVMASKAAYKTGMCGEDFSGVICETLKKNNLPVSCPYSPEELFKVSCSDKKRNGDTITLIVPEKMGKCVGKKIPVEEMLDFIKAGF